MALAHYQGYVENVSTGKALPAAVIRVYSYPGNVLQSTFADLSSTPLPTVLTDSNGAFEFYIPDGAYDLEYVFNGDVLTRLVNIAIFNPANYARGANVDAILGAAAATGHFGTFTGTTIADNSTVKTALQSLETATELRPTSATLAASGGSALVGVSEGGTAQEAFGARIKKAALQSTLTALTKATLVDGQVFETVSAKTTGDNGGAFYRWDAAATDTVNDGTILDNDAGGAGRYKYVGRAGAESITTSMFGVAESGITNLERKNRLQKAITAAYGKRLVIDHSDLLDYDSSSGAELEVDVVALNAAGGMEITGVNCFAQLNNGLRNVGNGIGLKVHNATGVDYNGDFILRRFSLWGDGTNANGGNIISLNRMNARTLLDNLDCFGGRENLVYAEDCYSMKIIDGVYNQARKSNIRLKNAANRVRLQGVTSFGAGRIMSAEYANIEIDGSASDCYAPVIDNCDFSYSANDAFQKFYRSDNTLTNIVVAGGTPTITAPAHGLTTGDKVCIMGATVAPLLNSIYGFSVTVTGVNTFTLPFTPAADGTYTEATLKVVPAAHGLWLNRCRGTLVNSPYCEDPALNAVYVTGASFGLVVNGGEFLQGRLHIDGAVGGKINGGYYHGARAGITVSTTDRHEIDASGFSLESGAYNDGVTKIDGEYRRTAQPSSGTWVAGDFVANSSPSVDGSNMVILGWKRLTSGSGNVAGTDWAVSRVSTVSPAT